MFSYALFFMHFLIIERFFHSRPTSLEWPAYCISWLGSRTLYDLSAPLHSLDSRHSGCSRKIPLGNQPTFYPVSLYRVQNNTMKSLEKNFIPYFPGHSLLFSGGIRLAMLYSIMYRACKTDDERVWGQTSFIFCPDLLSGGLNSPSDYCARVYFEPLFSDTDHIVFFPM